MLSGPFCLRVLNFTLVSILAGVLCYGENPMTDNNINPLNLDNDAAGPKPVNDQIDANSQHAFLSELAVSGDIQLAAIAAGHANDAGFFKLRQSDVAFAALWDAASDIAYSAAKATKARA
jgi:hypothetical protein